MPGVAQEWQVYRHGLHRGLLKPEARMSWCTDWFLADEAEAEAVASIASDDEHSFEDWPHLQIRSVGEMELMSLRGVLLSRPGENEDFHGDTLHQDYHEEGGVAVSRVAPEFINELAAVRANQVGRIAEQWHGCEPVAEWERPTVTAVLREMIAFARRANREGKPVLQLSTW